MIVPLNLTKFEQTVLNGGEWQLATPDWVILQLWKGSAYAFGNATSKDLPVSGVLLCPPKSSVRLMASVLGPAVFRGLSIRLSSLSGFMTALERQCLETKVARQCAPFLLLPADHPLAKQATHMFSGDNAMTLPNRLLLAQTFAELLGPQLIKAVNEGRQAEKGQQVAKNRLRDLINQMPESELADLSLGELAKLLHCCERHASRLFREVWGTGFLAYVSELRLKKSCHLLGRDRQKIIDIALESGFGSLAHFNYAFKKRYGMTPTEWRERNTPPGRRQSRPRPLAMVASLIFCLTFGLMAVYGGAGTETAGNGAVSNTNPTPTAAPVQRFHVDRYEVTGNTLLSTNLITRILSPYTGEAVDVETVVKAKDTLQLEYRDRGYPTVVVSVPPQPVTNRMILLAVTEGTLAEIRVVNNHFFSSNNIMRALPGLDADSGHYILNSKMFQAELDRANANPDRQISPELWPGPDPGTSELVLDVKDRLPLHGKLEYDDYSPPGTPGERVNANLTYDNLWQFDHSVGVQYGFSPERMKDGLDVPYMSLAPVDGPEIAYYSGFYRAPLGPPEAVANQITQNPGDFGFNETTRQFVVPPSTGRPEFIAYVSRSTTGTPLDTGALEDVVTNSQLLKIQQQAFSQQFTTETTAGGRFTIPCPVWGGIFSSVSFGADYKDDKVVTLATNFFYIESRITNNQGVVIRRDTLPVVGNTFPSLHYTPLFLGWSGSRADQWGQFNGGISTVWGMGGTFSRLESFPLQIAQTKKATTEFVALRPQLSRSQNLFQNFTFYANAAGQWANEPLVNLEQLAIGGASSVRGYHEGERYGDTGLTLQGEFRSPMYWLGDGKPKPIGVQLTGFTDYGEGYLLDPGSGQKAHEALWSSGMSVNLHFSPYVEGHISVAWPLIDSAFTQAGRARTIFSVSAQF